MLSPAQIKPFLLHPEKVIRDFAVSYFDDAELHDPELIPLILQAYDAAFNQKGFDPDDYTFMLAIGARFPCPDSLIPDLIERTRRTPFHSFQFQEMLLSCEPAAILAHDPGIAGKLDSFIRAEFEERLALSRASTDELWEIIFPAFKPADGFNYDRGDLAAKELAKRPDLPHERVMEALNAVAVDRLVKDTYNDIAFIMLLGQLRMEEAVPYLVEQLYPDDDLLNDAAIRSLVRIGTEDVVYRCRDAYLKAGELQKITISDAFGCIKHPAAETVLIELLKQEKDVGLATFLADGLCNLASKRAISLVQKRLEQGYDPTVLMLESSLYANCVVNGLELPEMADWKRAIEQEEERLRRNRKNAGNRVFDYDSDEADEEEWDDEFGFDDRSPSVPYIAPPKIGRNDPCPCGSGKKYKKCCM